MSFLIKLFTIQGNLVFMNNLYRKIAVASVCTALGFAVEANKEARAATFTFTSTRSFSVVDYNQDGVIDDGFEQGSERYVGLRRSEDNGDGEELGEYRSFYQFNIADLPLDSNTRIESAIFETRVNNFQYFRGWSSLQSYGYIEDFISFDNGEYLDGTEPLRYLLLPGPGVIARFNVLQFITNQRIENNDSFWLSIRTGNDEAFVTLSQNATLEITTAVPEPTTIFGSAIALGVGGWLKRKKSNQQNKKRHKVNSLL
jgi:hypothetical protein